MSATDVIRRLAIPIHLMARSYVSSNYRHQVPNEIYAQQIQPVAATHVSSCSVQYYVELREEASKVNHRLTFRDYIVGYHQNTIVYILDMYSRDTSIPCFTSQYRSQL